MTVYVDRLQNHAKKPNANSWWCHMWADNASELNTMAMTIGLKHSWIQVRPTEPKHHYDLSPSKRALAVQHGAVEMNVGEWMMARKEKQP